MWYKDESLTGSNVQAWYPRNTGAIITEVTKVNERDYRDLGWLKCDGNATNGV